MKRALAQPSIRHLDTPLVDMVQAAQDSGRTILSEDDVFN